MPALYMCITCKNNCKKITVMWPCSCNFSIFKKNHICSAFGFMGQKRTSEGECRGRLSEIWAGGITLGLTYCEGFRTDFTVCMHWVWCVLILLRVVCAFLGCRTGAEASLGRHSFAPPPPSPILKCTSFEVQPVILPVLFVAVVRFQDSDR